MQGRRELSRVGRRGIEMQSVAVLIGSWMGRSIRQKGGKGMDRKVEDESCSWMR